MVSPSANKLYTILEADFDVFRYNRIILLRRGISGLLGGENQLIWLRRKEKCESSVMANFTIELMAASLIYGEEFVERAVS